VEVVLAHLRETLPRDTAAASDVLEKRNNLVLSFGAAEGEDEECVVVV